VHFRKVLLAKSHSQKATANTLFQTAQYSQAIGEYDKALSSCPNYLEYEIAVLKSNIAACHLKLSDWKAAVDTATAALDALDRLTPKESKPGDGNDANAGVVEIEGEGAAAEEQMEQLKLSDERRSDVQRIRTKALLRRAKAKLELGGWGNLQAAEDGTRTPLLKPGP
jgi:tetratricopeptide (TPR) repeat protein